MEHSRFVPKSRRQFRLARGWARISAGELTCRVAEEGLAQVARRLALTPAVVRAATHGGFRLSPMRVLALREGVDLEWFLDAWMRARKAGHTDV